MGAALLGPGAMQHDSDRARVLGRNRGLDRPQALTGSATLAGAVGSVIDPVFALRRIAVVQPGERVTVDVLLGAGRDRAAVLAAVASASRAAALASAFDGAAKREQELAAALGLDATTAAAYQELAGAVLYGHPALRADGATVARAHGAPAQIWQYALGGAPVVLVQASSEADLAVVSELLAARAYWASKALRIDAAVLCGDAIDPAKVAALARKDTGSGTLFVRRQSELPAADVDVLLASAALVAGNGRGVRQLVAALGSTSVSSPTSVPASPAARHQDAAVAAASETLRFDNGVGGFSADGSEYVMRVGKDQTSPLAWVNVIATPEFGFFVSESGATHTWSRNSHENRLTPWYNDPIADAHAEALYIRDEASGAFWSPQPGPAPAEATYEVRHGFGYSTWRHRSNGLAQEVTTFVPRQDGLRIARIRLTDESRTARRVSLFSYHRLALGALASESARYVVSEHDATHGMLLAHNRVNGDFSQGEVFASVACEQPGARIAWTADRASFIGRNGSPAAPAGVAQGGTLDGRSGAGLDPCLALQVQCDVPAGGTVECAFLFGEAADRNAAGAVVQRYRRAADIETAFAATRAFWRTSLTAVQVETPVPAIDTMVNGWLLYQAMSCRIWGRSALYQSGGAFGFRDQLQDSAALVYAHPELTRAQILVHAAHQFVEGDVLHWWHPPVSRGTRTRFSDDLLWLPYIACFYTQTTGGWSVFDEVAPFLTAPLLAPGQDENYLLPSVANESGDVYTHCCRSIDRSLTRGAHGLPLMGTGDWNDGMNRVGREGRGESVWLGFFLYQVLADFVPVCERRGDGDRARRYREFRTDLGNALNDGGWDGTWYRRAYYDDGTPLGSSHNSECRIDVLAQTWAVISRAAPADRAAQAMQAVDDQLVNREAELIHLLWPPFDRDAHDPGYIKGYLPGIRENGGQYTHATTWALRAYAELGRRDRAAAYLEMLSPMHHSSTPERLAVYQVEPYVIAADVYGVAPHIGRGGWTWYTGSAAWMYRVAVESILGVRIEGGTTLVIEPRVPDEWPGFRVRLRLPDGPTQYEISVENPTRNSAKVQTATLDG
jgi:cyclic beta-1,2-glucan synthetase